MARLRGRFKHEGKSEGSDHESLVANMGRRLERRRYGGLERLPSCHPRESWDPGGTRRAAVPA